MSDEKLILVHYINIGNLSIDQVEEFINKVRKMTDGVDDNMSYYIPVRDSESRVECINPKLVDKDEYKVHLKRLKNAEKEFMSSLELISDEIFAEVYDYDSVLFKLEKNPYTKWWQFYSKMKWDREVLDRQIKNINKKNEYK